MILNIIFSINCHTGQQIYQSIIEYNRYLVQDPVRNFITLDGIPVKAILPALTFQGSLSRFFYT